jgi:SPP1 family phage portal protein
MIIKIDKKINNAFIIEAVKDKINLNHKLNRLHNYYIGQHDILLRRYPDPSAPSNRIIENYCRVIADVLMSYLVGVPVRYNDAPELILENLRYNDNDEATEQTVLNMNIFGFGTELFYTDAESVPRFASIDPRECIFVVDDTIEEKLLYFIRVYPKIGETEGYNVTLYTDKDYTPYYLSLAAGELKAAGAAVPHYFDDIPAVFYPNNRELIGSFENIMSLQDALNKLISDEINDFESFVNAFLVINGMQATTTDDVRKMQHDRVILLENEARAEWLIKDVNNDHIQALKDHISRRIRELGNIPDVENLGSFGSSGTAIKFKMIMSEIIASKQERTVYKGIQRKLELLYNIFKLTNKDLGSYTDVKPEFERNFIMLANDMLEEKKVDLQLVAAELMSMKTFLEKHEGMTADEAIAELKNVQKEKFGYGNESDMVGFYEVEREMLERRYADEN